MSFLHLVSWEEGKARAWVRELEAVGHTVRYEASDPGRQLRALVEDPPAAVLIDLSRSPSMGRDLGIALRVRASTRHVPLVFLEGAPLKVDNVREVLPDAHYAVWAEIASALDRALGRPLVDPVVPGSALAGYSGTPLPKKLGIKPGSRVLLAGAPPDFPDTLGPLPEGATLATRYSSSVGLILWFVRSRSELDAGIIRWRPRVGKEGIWIIWPKKGSSLESDVQQATVRGAGLDAGLVDYKIAAVDETWSGLKFSVRKKS